MVAALKFAKDAQGFNSYGPKPADLKWSVDLDNGTEATVTLPSDADFYTVSFRYQAGTSVWVDVTGAAAVAPILNTIGVTTSELNPATLLLAGGTEISIITANDTAEVGICAWQGGNT